MFTVNKVDLEHDTKFYTLWLIEGDGGPVLVRQYGGIRGGARVRGQIQSEAGRHCFSDFSRLKGDKSRKGYRLCQAGSWQREMSAPDLVKELGWIFSKLSVPARAALGDLELDSPAETRAEERAKRDVTLPESWGAW